MRAEWGVWGTEGAPLAEPLVTAHAVAQASAPCHVRRRARRPPPAHRLSVAGAGRAGGAAAAGGGGAGGPHRRRPRRHGAAAADPPGRLRRPGALRQPRLADPLRPALRGGAAGPATRGGAAAAGGERVPGAGPGEPAPRPRPAPRRAVPAALAARPAARPEPPARRHPGRGGDWPRRGGRLRGVEVLLRGRAPGGALRHGDPGLRGGRAAGALRPGARGQRHRPPHERRRRAAQPLLALGDRLPGAVQRARLGGRPAESCGACGRA